MAQAPKGRPVHGRAAHKIILTLDEPTRRWVEQQQAVKTPFGIAYMSTTAVVRGVMHAAISSTARKAARARKER